MTRRHTLRHTILFFLILAAVSPGAAQRVSPDSALRSILDSMEGTPLALEEAVRFALEHTTEVRTAEASLLAASGARRREAGSFDPALFLRLNYLDQQAPTASFFAGAAVLKTLETKGTAGLSVRLPIGTDIEASVNTVRLSTNSGFAFLNPQYTAFGSLSLRQPLLGGFHVSAGKQLSRADRELEAARARYDQEVLLVTTALERQYWDLYAAARDYAVQKLTRDRAGAFLNDTELRAKAGLIGPNQVANARTFLAEQEILLLDREEQFDGLSDRFASFIGKRPDSGMVRFVTTSDPPAEIPEPDLETLVLQALENNLELKAAAADIESQRALADASFWEALPRLDLVGSIAGNGLSGAPRDVIFGNDTLRTSVAGSLGDAVRQALKRDFPAWSIGLELTVPIGLRSGLGEQERLEAEVVMAEQRYTQRRRLLEEQVRVSHRELSHGRRRLLAALDGVNAAQEQVRIGLIEFQNGRTTAFELVRLGADYAVAQQRYSQALVRSAKAAADLRQLSSGAFGSLSPVE